MLKVFLIGLCIIGSISCQHSSSRHPSSIAVDPMALYHQNFDPICRYGYSEEVSDAQVGVIAAGMANRDHRIWHYFWHSTRNSWHELTAEQQAFFLSFDPRWKPARLLGEPTGFVILNHQDYDPKFNNAGEDFFFMHHQMTTHLFQSLANAGLPCIAPWKSLPPKDDPLWALSGELTGPKDDESYKKMEAWRKSFANINYLSSKTLGEIGYNLEISLHNNMHMRWTTDNPPDGFGERPEITPQSLKQGLALYDDPRYNWLADPYSAHVNKVFWKLHGLVESVIFNWLASQQMTTIAESCSGQAGCYDWKGTWVGGAPQEQRDAVGAAPGHHHGGDVPKEMQQGDSFADSFGQAFNNFVNGRSATRGLPKGAVQAAPPLSAKEKARRRRVVMDALKKLHKNAPMNRGALTRENLQSTSGEIYNDPAEYVHFIEQKERAQHGGH